MQIGGIFESQANIGRDNLINCDLNESAFLDLYRKYCDQAKRHGHTFKLSENEFRRLARFQCFYCEVAPNQKIYVKNKKGVFIYNDISRSDPSKDYIKRIYENCSGEITVID